MKDDRRRFPIPRHADSWTYRYRKNKQTGERNGSSLKQLLQIAVDDLERGSVLPVHIRADGRIVMDQDDIAEAWAEKYLPKK